MLTIPNLSPVPILVQDIRVVQYVATGAWLHDNIILVFLELVEEVLPNLLALIPFKRRIVYHNVDAGGKSIVELCNSVRRKEENTTIVFYRSEEH